MSKRSNRGDYPMPVSTTDRYRSETVSVRPIENGFLKSVSCSGPDGYTSKETFHRKEPSLSAGRSSGGGSSDATGSQGLRGAKDC